MNKRERELLLNSRISREKKNFIFQIPEDYWVYGKPIPSYHTKVISEITLKLNLRGAFYHKKLKVHDKLAAFILNLPSFLARLLINQRIGFLVTNWVNW